MAFKKRLISLGVQGLRNSQVKNLSTSYNLGKEFAVRNINEFETKVLNSTKPVVVNFHAEWCEPCKLLSPVMSKLLANSDDIDLAIINVEDSLELVQTFEVKAVPAVIAFRNGILVDKFVGLVDYNMIEGLVNKLKPPLADKTT